MSALPPSTPHSLPLFVSAPPRTGEPMGGSDPVIAELVAPGARSTSIQLSPAVASLLNNRLAVIAILAVAGPIGLPALWFSGRFGRTSKIVVSLLYVAFTVIFPLALVYYCCEIALRPLVDAFSAAGV